MSKDLENMNDELRFYRGRRLQCAFLAAATLALTLGLPGITGAAAKSFIAFDPGNSVKYRQDTATRTPYLQGLAGLATILYGAGFVRFHKNAKGVEQEIDALRKQQGPGPAP